MAPLNKTLKQTVWNQWTKLGFVWYAVQKFHTHKTSAI